MLCLALLCSNYSNAQVDSTTGNLINFTGTPTATTSNWVNGVYVNQLCFQAGQPGNCGPNPSVRAASGNINFSYGTVDLHQIVNINAALAAGGNGVQLSGFNYSFTAKNGNGWDDARQDYLAAYVKLYNSAGAVAANYDYSAQTNQRYNWTNFSFNETFATPQLASQYSNAQVGFVGRDNNFWAGNYGPEIMNVSFALKYKVDPCALNPAYSPNCTGFNNVVTSNNILPQPDTWGTSMNQIVAINTALKNGGIGATVHGFNYGFDYTIGQSWSGCTATNQDGSCSWYMNIPAQASVTAQLTNSNNQSLHSRNYSLTGDGTSGSVSGQYLLPSSLSQTSLGNVRLYGSTSGSGSSIGNFSASLIYTADPCVSNPLYSTNCSGYAVAYAKNMLLGSTVASASGPVVSSGNTSMSTNTGTVDQSNPQSEQQQTQQPQQQTQQQSNPSSQPDAGQNPSVASADPAQPSPTQAGPASTSPQPAGGPPQATQTASASSSSGPGGGGSAGPSKLAMSVLKSAQDKDKATQNAAVQAAAKTLEGSMQSSQASSNLAISLNQDMSANSATAAAAFASQTTQASQQTATQSSQGPQQTAQASTQTTSQSSKLSLQEQQSQQETQQAQVQSSTNDVQYQPPKQQETQQAQIQTSTSVVKLIPPVQQEVQQAQTQSTTVVQYQSPQQQEQQQTQSQSSSSVVKLLPPQQQEQQQTQSQMTASMMPLPQSTYTAPQQAQDTQSTQVTALKPPTAPVVEVQQQASSGTGLTINRNMFAYNPFTSSMNSSMQSMTQQQPQPVFQQQIDQKQFEVETPQMPMASFGGAGKAGNPLNEIMMQQRFEMMQNNVAQPTGSVNKNVQPNELAGGVDIATMASVPAGFSAYSIVLKDSAFYEPKEVYKNQKTVDNERVLRGLTRGSDSLHQRMVDQQYKVGN